MFMENGEAFLGDHLLLVGRNDMDGEAACVVEGERSVYDRVLDLTACRHDGQGCGIQGRLHLAVAGLDCGKHRDAWHHNTEAMQEIDGVLTDVPFLIEIRLDVDGRIGASAMALRISAS